MRFLIVIPVHNRLELTRGCLLSLSHQDFRGFRIFLVDDGSTDGTTEAVPAEFGGTLNIEVLQGDGGLWWAGGIEMGVRRALREARDSDYIVTLNNDLTVEHDFLSKAREILARYPGAMVGGLSLDSRDRDRIATTGWQMLCWPLALTRRVWWPCTRAELACKPPVAEVDFLPGTATFTPVSIVRKVGTVDAGRLPHYHADSEYSYRLKRSGVSVLLSRDLIVFHNLRSTGVLSNVGSKPRLTHVLTSFFERRSGNYWRYKWAFARTCAPLWALVPFLVCDTIKALTRSLGAFFFGGRIDKLRARFNP